MSAVEAANVKAAADEELIQAAGDPERGSGRAAGVRPLPAVTNYQVVKTYELGGSNPNPLTSS